jgi:gluconolactonase
MWHGQVEGTDIVVLDPRFKACFPGHARVERLWSGARWAEGPAWFAAGRYLIWSDIPNNRMMRLVEPSGEVSVFANTPTIRTAIPSTIRVGWSPASISRAA